MEKPKLIKIKISDIVPNTGQIPDVPKNPRFIRDEKYEALLRSMRDDPEHMEINPLKVYLYDGKYVTISGNHRLRAAKELKWKEIDCFIIPQETPTYLLRKRAITENEIFSSTDYDIIKEEWDIDECLEWGMDVEFLKHDENDDLNMDDFFEEVENGEARKNSDNSISITVPKALEEKLEEIRNKVKTALADYQGVIVR